MRGWQPLVILIVDITERPIFAGFKRTDDRMFRRLKVPGGVMIRRTVTAAHVPARLAQAKMDPLAARLQTVLASIRARRDLYDLIDVLTVFHRTSE